jgi:hypothetical protein
VAVAVAAGSTSTTGTRRESPFFIIIYIGTVFLAHLAVFSFFDKIQQKFNNKFDFFYVSLTNLLIKIAIF